MKLLSYIGVLVFTISLMVAEPLPVVSKEQVDAVEADLVSQPAQLKEEIIKLRVELDQLKADLETSAAERESLNTKIDDYRRQEQFSENALFKLSILREVISKAPFTVSLINDEDYEAALSNIKLGDLGSAQEKLSIFLLKQINLNSYLEAVPGSDITEVKLATLQTALEHKIDEANFLNGYVKLLLFKPKEAADYLAKSYNSTKNINLALLNLMVLVDVFYATGQVSEACFTVKSFESTLTQISTRKLAIPSFINDKVTNRVKTIKKEFSCN